MQSRQPDRHRFRYVNTLVSPYTINYLHLRNPWVTAWWSAAFPGFGHLMLCKYMVAYCLMLWELAINSLTGINRAIFLTMTGHFAAAEHALNTQWLLLYIPPYVFCIWDSYRKTVELNNVLMEGYWFGDTVLSKNVSSLELNYLDKRIPALAAIWSLLAPGLGHFYLNRLFSVLFIGIYSVIVIHFSHLLPAVQMALTGHFRHAANILDPQWLLYVPSVYGFAAYDAYINGVEYNRLFEKEQARFFAQTFQSESFPLLEELPCIR